jgi:predicted O-methyltransferase YrrM
MEFQEALRRIAHQLGLDGDDLIMYAEQDQVQGSNGLDGRLIPFTNDGKLLYALVRALKPRRVFESGTNEGGSAVHLAMAMRDNGPDEMGVFGRVITVDIRQDSGRYIPVALRRFVDVIHADIRDVMQSAVMPECQFVHEDASHQHDTVFPVYKRLPDLMPRGGVIVSHDTATDVGGIIQAAIQAAGFPRAPEYKYEGSPCGFSVMRYQP